MHGIIEHRRVGRLNIAALAWTLPALIVVLMAAAAVASLLAGLITPDLIGADGLSSSMLGVP